MTLIFLFLFCGGRQMYCVEENKTRGEIDNAMRVQLAQGRLPHVVKQTNGDYTVVAIRSSVVAGSNLTCAEFYDVPKGELEDFLSLKVIAKQENFIQVVTEDETMLLIIRLRTDCAEN